MLTHDSLEEVFREARGYESRPLWTIMDKMVPAEPTPRAVPHLWTYKPLKALLDRAGELIRAEEAERRVLMLINPKLELLTFVFGNPQLLKLKRLANCAS